MEHRAHVQDLNVEAEAVMRGELDGPRVCAHRVVDEEWRRDPRDQVARLAGDRRIGHGHAKGGEAGVGRGRCHACPPVVDLEVGGLAGGTGAQPARTATTNDAASRTLRG